MLVQLVTGGKRLDAETLAPEAVAARILPVARIQFGDAAPGGAAEAPKTGEEVYKAVCATCHAGGLAGAHKFGDKAAWAPHLKEGLAALSKNAINGIRAMPARGGNPNLSDLEVTRAVAYMGNAAGANFKEPAAPAAAAPAAAKPAAAAEQTGQQIVTTGCGNCHLTGEGGAPKIGDRAAWSKRISAGLDKVTTSAIRGHGGMPARGGFADLTDADMKKAILYMFDAGAGKVALPAAAPAPAAQAAPAAASGEQLLQKNACIACHAVDKKLVGPSYKDVAAKYAGDKGAIDALVKKIKAGGAGVWGQMAMPPHPQVSEADLQAMVKYVLAMK
jgi:cytochrome c5